MNMKLNEFLKELNVPDKVSFDSEDELAFEIAEMVIGARVYSGMTQEKLAEKLGTSQPSVARLESGNTLPSLKFLLRVAQALNTSIIPPKFEIVKQAEDVANSELRSNVHSTNKQPNRITVTEKNISFLIKPISNFQNNEFVEK